VQKPVSVCVGQEREGLVKGCIMVESVWRAEEVRRRRRCLVWSVWLASREGERVGGGWKTKGQMAKGGPVLVSFLQRGSERLLGCGG